MTEYRWPERECFHANVAFALTVSLTTGEVVNSVPIRCVDCGADFEDK